MSEEAHKSHFKLYMLVFVALGVLTFIELFVPDMDASTAIKGGILTTLAGIKAWMVAYYYMHLNEESIWLKFIAAIPISAAIYTLVVVLESMYR